MRGPVRFVLPLLAGTLACSSAAPAPPPAAQVRMSFDRPDFFAAPFPSDDLRNADGSIALGGFPDPNQIAMVEDARTLLAQDARGFSMAGGIFFSLTQAIDQTHLPAMADTVTAGATVFVVGLSPGPDAGVKVPVSVAFEPDGGPFGAANMLSLVPLQGRPLRPASEYAAVVLRSAADPPLAPSATMQSIAGGAQPATMPAAAFQEYTSALASLAPLGIAPADVAALTVFTTDSPLDTFARVAQDVLSHPFPVPGPFTLTDTFPDYCVFQATIGMPDYQSGAPPFTTTGGAWSFDASGNPIVARVEPATFVLSVPRSTMPSTGFPTVLFVRAGGGGNRPLVDRGTQATNGGPPIVPGSGPALEMARAGYAGVQIDGPLEGLRNTTNGNEDYLIFNVFNGAALRDNIRESAIELVLQAHLLDALSVAATACPGAPAAVKLDTTRMAIMGHSMGASILPLALAFEPRLKAAVLSGAGASWIANVVYKQQPLDVKSAIELLVEYTVDGRSLTDHDPVVTLIQWAAEPADSQIYASRILREVPAGFAPRQVLMVQGIVDHYILPPIANAVSVPLGLDLAGPELDTTAPELASMTPFEGLFPYSGRGAVAYPVTANFGGTATATLVQWPGDGIEDGHEVIFQTDPPKYQYKCFLSTLLKGTPTLYDGTGKHDTDACP